MPHETTANGMHDDDPNTPVEALAVIGKRVWEARSYAKAAMNQTLITHQEVVAMRAEKALYPRLTLSAAVTCVVLLVICAVLLGMVLAKVW